MDDRISELPIPTLHHILCFLSQKEAVRTCILSKQWRHVGTTRPNLDFSEEWSDDTQEKFVFIIDGTLQGYRDKNLSVHQLCLNLCRSDSRPVVSLLDKWIPIIAALNIKAFKLDFLSYTAEYYNLPSAVFLAESLEELHLCKCRLSLVPLESLQFKRLRTLTLREIQVDDGTFEKITWGCPLLRRLFLYSCEGLRNVRLNEVASPRLNHFVLSDYETTEGRSIEIDVPNIETLSIRGKWIWSHRQSALLFSRLTSLHIRNVILSSEFIDLLSFGCPTLASLTLNNCSGFEEFHLSSDSVKLLSIRTEKILLKGVTICAPNIVSFDFIAGILQVPATFSFTTTTSKEWSSQVFLSSSSEEDPDFDVTSWFLKLRRVLTALSGSQIDLTLLMNGGSEDVPCSAVDCSCLLGDRPPVMVENLTFNTSKWRPAWYSSFTNGLFRVCRPRHVQNNHPFSEFQFNIFLANESLRTEPCFWRHDLEQVHVKTVNGKKWQLVQWTDLSELENRTNDGIMCLKLKWRDPKTESVRQTIHTLLVFLKKLSIHSCFS